MKKTAMGVLVAAMLMSPVGLAAAHASPTAPRAQVVAPAAPRAAQAPAAPQGPCFNIDQDQRVLCILNGKPEGQCHEILGLGHLVTYWRCGEPNPKPQVPVGCSNLNGDNQFTCLGPAQPNGDCTNTFNILIIHGYTCTKGGGGLLPGH
jgi:hypothetical protein